MRVIIGILGKNDDSGQMWRFSTSSGIQFLLGANTPIPIAGEDTHIALVRNGTNFQVYIDGVSVVSTTDADAMPNVSAPLTFASSAITSTSMFNGKSAGLRITKGSARYTADFTPPTSFDIDGSDVVFCSNFDTIYDEDYVMVQHMGDSLVDATGNGNNGTNVGTTVG